MLRRVTQSQLEAEIARRPGLIPVAFRSVRGEVIWLDLNQFHCSEGFFGDSLAVYSQQRGAQREWFLSAFETLLSPAAAEGCIRPTGFIFHAGRCGSTLLAKALASCVRNLVFSEAAPHNQIWEVLEVLRANGEGMPGIGAYRGLAVLMGRPRVASYSAHFIKFSSYNIVQ